MTWTPERIEQELARVKTQREVGHFEEDSLWRDYGKCLRGLKAALAEVERLKAWVNDCQAGMYINCVYCGHRYGPDDEVPATMADVLKAHIEQCPEHPMSALKAENTKLTAEVAQAKLIGAAEELEKMAAECIYWITLYYMNGTPRASENVALKSKILESAAKLRERAAKEASGD